MANKNGEWASAIELRQEEAEGSQKTKRCGQNCVIGGEERGFPVHVFYSTAVQRQIVSWESTVGNKKLEHSSQVETLDKNEHFHYLLLSVEERKSTRKKRCSQVETVEENKGPCVFTSICVADKFYSKTGDNQKIVLEPNGDWSLVP